MMPASHAAGRGTPEDARRRPPDHTEEVENLRERLRVLGEERVPALVQAELGVRDVRGDEVAVRAGRDAVVPPARHERRARDALETIADVVAGARVSCSGSPRSWSLVFRPVLPRPSSRRATGRRDEWRAIPCRSACRGAGRPAPRVRFGVTPARAADTTGRLRRRATCTRTRRSTRSGAVTASSWATMPPKLTPNTRTRQSSSSSSAIAWPRSRPSCTDRAGSTSARAALVVRGDVEPLANGSISSALVASVEPEPLRNSSGGPLPERSK